MEAQTLNLLNTPLSYKEQQDFFYSVMSDVEAGGADALEIMLKAKAMIRICNLIVDGETDSKGNLTGFAGVKDQALEGAQKHVSGSIKEFEYKGVKISVGENGTKYDFTNCGDVKWESYKNIESSAATSRKEREATLKTLKSSLTEVDPDSGEIYTIAPPIKKSTTGLTIKFQ